MYIIMIILFAAVLVLLWKNYRIKKEAKLFAEKVEDLLLVTFNAVPSVILLGWLLGLKSVEVVEPQNVREDIINLLQHNMNFYEEKN